MEQTVCCQGCAANNPAEARFCIECGAALGAASTGPTVKLSGKVCWSCGAVCPNDAVFCTRCGQTIQAQPAPRPQQSAPPRWTPPPAPPWSRPRRHIHPRIHSSPSPVRMPRTQPPQPIRSNQSLILLLALIGLVMLGVTHTVWPAVMLIMLGIALLSEHRGRPVFTVNGLLLLVCLLVGFSTGFWPIFFLFLLVRNR